MRSLIASTWVADGNYYGIKSTGEAGQTATRRRLYDPHGGESKATRPLRTEDLAGMFLMLPMTMPCSACFRAQFNRKCISNVYFNFVKQSANVLVQPSVDKATSLIRTDSSLCSYRRAAKRWRQINDWVLVQKTALVFRRLCLTDGKTSRSSSIMCVTIKSTVRKIRLRRKYFRFSKWTDAVLKFFFRFRLGLLLSSAACNFALAY